MRFSDITESKKAEEALRDSEEKFSKAFNASPDCMAISRLGDGRYIEVNDSFIRFTGYSREYILGKSFNNIKKWDEAGSRDVIMEKLRKDGRVVKEDFSFRVKSGEVKSMLYSAETLKIGGVDCVLSVTTDITERKKAEEALRDSEEKFSKAFRATPIGVCITSNQDNRFIEVNDSFYRFTGYSHGEVIGHSASELNLWVDEDERLKFYGDFFEKGRVYNAEFRSRMKSGEIRTSCASAENLTIRGEPCRMLVLADITERKMAELALADSEKKLRIMFDSVISGIAVADLNGKITGVNRRILDMHGFADDSEVIGNNALDLVVPQERERAAVNITNNLKERKSTSLEYTLLRKDGSHLFRRD